MESQVSDFREQVYWIQWAKGWDRDYWHLMCSLTHSRFLAEIPAGKQGSNSPGAVMIGGLLVICWETGQDWPWDSCCLREQGWGFSQVCEALMCGAHGRVWGQHRTPSAGSIVTIMQLIFCRKGPIVLDSNCLRCSLFRCMQKIQAPIKRAENERED